MQTIINDPGNTIHLPVNVAGGLLHIGDGHAVQGDAEACGVAKFPKRYLPRS